MGVGARLEEGLLQVARFRESMERYLHIACFGSLGRFEAFFQAQKKTLNIFYSKFARKLGLREQSP
jgi:hypothetical protein